MLPELPLDDEGVEGVEPLEVDGIDGAPGEPVDGIGDDVVPPGNEGAPPLGEGEGIEGIDDPEEPGVLGIELPDGLPLGLGVEGAPPPDEFVLQPLARRIAVTAIATNEERGFKTRMLIGKYLWLQPSACRSARQRIRHPR
jgi:hypothetical protein